MATWTLIPDCEWLDTEEKVVEAGYYLANTPRKLIGFDTETTGINIAKDYPLMFSLSDGVRRFAGLWSEIQGHPGWGHHYAIKDWVLENPDVGIVGTNIKFDCHMSKNRGVWVQGPLRCTLTMDWLFDENRWGHDLKATARDHCGIKMRDFKQVFPMRKKTKKRPGETAGEAILRKLSTPEGFAEAKEYAGLDAYASMRVHDFLEEKLKDDFLTPDLSYWEYFLGVEVPFTRVLFNMECRGVKIATGHLKSQLGPMQQEINNILASIAEPPERGGAGHPINPNSTKQLRRYFFEENSYPVYKWTDGGKSGVKKPSTDAEVLKKYAAEHGCKVSKRIIECRKVVKIKGTYIEGPLELVDDNLRLHTSFKQHGAVTGRLASSEPNLMNLPRPGSDAYKIRAAFVAEPGNILLVRDYAQLEMRIMAHFSQDPRMIQAIYDGLDLHCYTVSLMYGVEYDEVIQAKRDKDDGKNLTDRQKLLLGYRQAAKNIGFGLIYGIGPQKLGQDLSAELKREITLKEAQGMIRNYFNIFRGAEKFIKGTHARCRNVEFVQTITGRKRRLPSINASGGRDKNSDVNAKGIAAQARRQSVNSIIQGTAADIAKYAMLLCEHDEALKNYGVQLLLQVHDELVFELPHTKEAMQVAEEQSKFLMENPFGVDFQLSVPIPTSSDFVYDWASAK